MENPPIFLVEMKSIEQVTLCTWTGGRKLICALRGVAWVAHERVVCLFLFCFCFFSFFSVASF